MATDKTSRELFSEKYEPDDYTAIHHPKAFIVEANKTEEFLNSKPSRPKANQRTNLNIIKKEQKNDEDEQIM